MSHAISTQIQLARRPEGWPTHDDFRTVEVELSDPAPGRCAWRTSSSPSTPICAGG